MAGLVLVAGARPGGRRWTIVLEPTQRAFQDCCCSANEWVDPKCVASSPLGKQTAHVIFVLLMPMNPCALGPEATRSSVVYTLSQHHIVNLYSVHSPLFTDRAERTYVDAGHVLHGSPVDRSIWCCPTIRATS